VIPDTEKGRRFIAEKGAPNPLVVGVTGAHYYGFPSPDSDLDLKGIHVAPTADVVSLSPSPETIDVIEVFQGLEIDYTSHEVGLALRLLLKGNGNMLERIVSPFQLRDSPLAEALRKLARDAISKRFFHHYRGFHERMVQDWRKAEPKTVKGLLYAYRSALTGIHLLTTGDCVGDVTTLARQYGFDRVKDLVARKGRSTEHGAMPDSGDFDVDLQRLESLLEDAHRQSTLPEEAQNRPLLDAFLIDMRRRSFANW
jgi:predicted nucleotidyltransferase